jgi:hypothetical protein
MRSKKYTDKNLSIEKKWWKVKITTPQAKGRKRTCD